MIYICIEFAYESVSSQHLRVSRATVPSASQAMCKLGHPDGECSWTRACGEWSGGKGRGDGDDVEMMSLELSLVVIMRGEGDGVR